MEKNSSVFCKDPKCVRGENNNKDVHEKEEFYCSHCGSAFRFCAECITKKDAEEPCVFTKGTAFQGICANSFKEFVDKDGLPSQVIHAIQFKGAEVRCVNCKKCTTKETIRAQARKKLVSLTHGIACFMALTMLLNGVYYLQQPSDLGWQDRQIDRLVLSRAFEPAKLHAVGFCEKEKQTLWSKFSPFYSPACLVFTDGYVLRKGYIDVRDARLFDELDIEKELPLRTETDLKEIKRINNPFSPFPNRLCMKIKIQKPTFNVCFDDSLWEPTFALYNEPTNGTHTHAHAHIQKEGVLYGIFERKDGAWEFALVNTWTNRDPFYTLFASVHGIMTMIDDTVMSNFKFYLAGSALNIFEFFVIAAAALGSIAGFICYVLLVFKASLEVATKLFAHFFT